MRKGLGYYAKVGSNYQLIDDIILHKKKLFNIKTSSILAYIVILIIGSSKKKVSTGSIKSGVQG